MGDGISFSSKEPDYEYEPVEKEEEQSVEELEGYHRITKISDFEKDEGKQNELHRLEEDNKLANHKLTTLKILEANIQKVITGNPENSKENQDKLENIQHQIKDISNQIDANISTIQQLKTSIKQPASQNTAKKVLYCIIKGFKSPLLLMGWAGRKIDDKSYRYGAARRGVSKTQQLAVIELKRALNTPETSFIDMHRTHIQKSQEDLSLNQELALNNNLLKLAIKNNRIEEFRYIIENNLYKKITLKVLYSLMVKTPLKDQPELLWLLFKQAKNPEELSKIIHFLSFEGDKLVAKKLIAKGLESFSADLVDHDKFSPKYALFRRCQLLALQLGDETLFEKAFPGFNPSHFNPLEAKGKEMLTKFAASHGDVLSLTNKNGCTPTMHAALGNNVKITAFIAEAEKINNAFYVEQIEKLINSTSALKNILNSSVKSRDILDSLQAIKGTIQDLDNKYFKSFHFSNALTHKLWVKLQIENKLDSIISLLSKYSESGEKGPLPKGILVDAAKLHNRFANIIKLMKQNSNPYLIKNKAHTTATHMIDMEFANQLDNLYSLDSNALGSFSSLLNARSHLHKPYNKKEIASMMVGGAAAKWATAFGVVAFMNSHEHMGIPKSLAFSRISLLLAVSAGVFIAKSLVRAVRKREAFQLGLNKILQQYEQIVIGKSAAIRHEHHKVYQKRISRFYPLVNKIRGALATKAENKLECAAYASNLPLLLAFRESNPQKVLELLQEDREHQIVIGRSMIQEFNRLLSCTIDGVDKRSEILQLLCERCPYQDGKNAVYFLLKGQINAGHKSAVKTAINRIAESIDIEYKYLKKDIDYRDTNQHARLLNKAYGVMLSAALLGSVSTMESLLKNSKALLEENPSIKNGTPTDHLLLMRDPVRGNTLLHLAAKSNNPRLVLLLSSKMNQKKGLIEIGRNSWTLTNKSGEHFTEMMSLQLAKQLDQYLNSDEQNENSFTRIHERVEVERRNRLYTQYGGVLPSTFILNSIPVIFMHHLLQEISMMLLHTSTGGLSLAVEATSEFLIATAVSLFNSSLGKLAMTSGWRYALTVKRFIQGYNTIPGNITLSNIKTAESEELFNRRLVAAYEAATIDKEESRDPFSKAEKDRLVAALTNAIEEVKKPAHHAQIEDLIILDDIEENLNSTISEGVDPKEIQKNLMAHCIDLTLETQQEMARELSKQNPFSGLVLNALKAY